MSGADPTNGPAGAGAPSVGLAGTAAVRLVDTTLRDMAAPPWGAGIGTEEVAAAAAALGRLGASALEALDPASARTALGGRAESPWDRLRAVVRVAGATPVGVVVSARTLWGEWPCTPDMARRFVLGAGESGARRVRAFDALNHAEALAPIALAAAEAQVAFVPTLVVGPVPDPDDPRWIDEAEALAALPVAVALCVADEAGHLAPAALGDLVARVAERIGLPVEVALQASAGLAPVCAVAAVAAGAAAVHAAIGPIAVSAGRPSAEGLRAALAGGPRPFAVDDGALEAASAAVGPAVPPERLRAGAAAAGGPAIALPPELARGLGARLGRLGVASRLADVTREVVRVARDAGAPTLAHPLGTAVAAQAARHLVEGRRWAEVEPAMGDLLLGRDGPLRGPVDPDALAAARAAEGQSPAPAAPALPEGASEEDHLLVAQFPQAAARLLQRRRSLGEEVEEVHAAPALDRALLETLVDVVEAAGEAEVMVELAGARVTVRRSAPAVERAVEPAVAQGDGLVAVESPMVGIFYRASSPGAEPYVREGERVSPGQTLCIIEAMKLFNEIVAEHGGTVREILVDNAEPVEYGQPLFLLAP